jgi:hypothetical protein
VCGAGTARANGVYRRVVGRAGFPAWRHEGEATLLMCFAEKVRSPPPTARAPTATGESPPHARLAEERCAWSLLHRRSAWMFAVGIAN